MRETQMRKFEFIISEIINDLGIQQGTWQSKFRTVVTASVVFEMRMMLHYLGQFVFLKLMDCPVTKFEFTWYKIRMEYAYLELIQ